MRTLAGADLAATPSASVADLLRWGVVHLEKRGISEPRLSTEWLLAKVLEVKRLDLFSHYDKSLNRGQLEEFKGLIARRAEHVPVQQLLGEWDFYGLPFSMEGDVLIPRPETEILVESLLKVLPKNDIKCATHGLDLGVGSGNIAVTLLKHLPESRCIAIDLSPKALRLAGLNARRHGVSARMELRQGDWYEALENNRDSFDWIVSNPPYIPAKDWSTLPEEVRRYESRLALWGGESGIEPYEIIIRGACQYLKPGGWLALEVGDAQASEVQVLVATNKALCLDRVVKDNNGIDRVILARRSAV